MVHAVILKQTYNVCYIAFYLFDCMVSKYVYLLVGARVSSLLAHAHHKIDKALRHCTSVAYVAKSKLFVTFSLHVSAPSPAFPSYLHSLSCLYKMAAEPIPCPPMLLLLVPQESPPVYQICLH